MEQVKTVFNNMLSWGSRVFGRLGALVKGWGGRLWALLPGEVREKTPWLEGGLGFVLAGLVLVLVLLPAVFLLAAAGSPPAEEPRTADFGPVPIPREELFLPEEPDFLPPVILEREQRDLWTAEDAEPFWYNPLEDGEEEWRRQVEKVVDELLERIP
jgi:hypothetical protein